VADSNLPPRTGSGGGDSDDMIIELTEIIEEPRTPPAAPEPPRAKTPPPAAEPPDRSADKGLAQDDLDSLLRELNASPGTSPGPQKPPPAGGWIEPAAPPPAAGESVEQDDLDALLRDLSGQDEPVPGPLPFREKTPTPPPLDLSEDLTFPEQPAPAVPKDTDAFFREIAPDQSLAGEAAFLETDLPEAPDEEGGLVQADLNALLAELEDKTPAEVLPPESVSGAPEEAEESMTQAELDAMLREIEEETPPSSIVEDSGPVSGGAAELSARLREIEEETPPPSIVEDSGPVPGQSAELDAMLREIEGEITSSPIVEDSGPVPGRAAELDAMLREIEEETPPSSIVEDGGSVTAEGAELDALLKEVESIQVPAEAEVMEPELARPLSDRPEAPLDEEAVGATPLVLGVTEAAAVEDADESKLREMVRGIVEEMLPGMVRPIIVAEIQEIVKALKKSSDS
jgi:hypothetical protein